MTNYNDGGPAFPNLDETLQMGDALRFKPGMSLRDWFAGQALVTLGDTNPNLPGSMASGAAWPNPEDLAERKARWAYFQADAMLEARK